jgi:hypothetical protein
VCGINYLFCKLKIFFLYIEEGLSQQSRMENDRHEAVFRYLQTKCEIESLPNIKTASHFYSLELSGQAKHLKY